MSRLGSPRSSSSERWARAGARQPAAAVGHRIERHVIPRPLRTRVGANPGRRPISPRLRGRPARLRLRDGRGRTAFRARARRTCASVGPGPGRRGGGPAGRIWSRVLRGGYRQHRCAGAAAHRRTYALHPLRRRAHPGPESYTTVSAIVADRAGDVAWIAHTQLDRAPCRQHDRLCREGIERPPAGRRCRRSSPARYG